MTYPLVKVKAITKSAIAWPVAVAAGLALYLGAQWLISHMSDPDTGLLANCNRAAEKLEALKTTSWYEGEIDTTVKSEVDNLLSHIKKIREMAVKLDQLNDMLYKPRTLSEMGELDKLKTAMEDHGDEAHRTVEDFKNLVKETKPLLDQAIANFKSDYYQHQHTKDTWLGELGGRLGELLHGRWGLIANDYISAVNALEPLEKSMEEAVKRLEEMPKIITQKEEEIKDGVSKLEAKPGEISQTPEEKHWWSIISDITGEKPKPEEMSFLANLPKY